MIVSFFYFDLGNYRPLINENGPMGILVGGTLVFYAYLGFDIIPAIAEEAKNPKRDVPRAIIHQVIYVGIFYVIVAFAVNG